MAKRTTSVLAVLLLCGFTAFGQSSVKALGGASDAAQRVFDNQVQQPADTVMELYSVQEKPEFPGGTEAMFTWLKEAVQYPEDAVERKVQGRVYVEFVIGKDGAVGHVEVARGVDRALDAEAVRAVRAMPNWMPGRMDGKLVAVKQRLPIAFVLPTTSPGRGQ